VYGMSAITSIVTMNPETWEHDVLALDTDILRKQLRTVFNSGIKPDAMKTGMLGSVEIIEAVNEFLSRQRPKNLVVDPVLACKGDTEVQSPEVAEAIKEQILPYAHVLTPNMREAGILSGMGKLESCTDAYEAAKRIHSMGPKNVVIKNIPIGTIASSDLWYDGRDFISYTNQKLVGEVCNHGAGCTFAAAITAGLANGKSVETAVAGANRLVHDGIKKGFRLNKHCGVLNISK
jgi:pyridoxine kinase